MAPTHSLPALLVLLTLAASLLPAATGQQPTTSGAIVLSTSAATYPPGGEVLFTLTNARASETVWPLQLQVIANARPVAWFNFTGGAVLPMANLSFNWTALVQGTPAATGSYYALLRYNLTQQFCGFGGTCTTQNFTRTDVYVNGRTPGGDPGWRIEPAPPTAPGLLVVATSNANATFAAGEPVGVVFANAGGVGLEAGGSCEVEFLVVEVASGAVVHDSYTSELCTSMVMRLEPAASSSFVWNQSTSAGVPAAPGAYRIDARWGASVASVNLTLAAAAEVAPPPPSPPPPPPPPPTKATARLELIGPLAPASPGQALHFNLTNRGEAAVEGTFAFQVRDRAGAVVYAPGFAQVVQTLGPGASLAFAWDQRTDAGGPAPPGTYTVEASFAGAAATAAVTLAAAPEPTPAPTPRPEPEPPAPAPAPEERPVVGTIEANVTAGAEGCYAGDWVSFCIDHQARRLRDFRADGRLVVRELALPGSGAIRVETTEGALRVLTDGAAVIVYDTPAGALRVEAAAANLDLQLGEGVQSQLTDEGASFQAGGVEGLVVVSGGEVRRDGGRLTVTLSPSKDRPTSSVVLRATAGPEDRDPADAGARAELKAALPQAIATQKVAAETYIARSGAGVKTSVVPYIAADVTVSVDRAAADELQLTVDVADHAGRTLVFHVGDGVFDARAGYRVLFDGAPMQQAADLQDVLDPDDDGLAAEYVVVQGSAGLQLIVSVPHFSVHTVSLQGLGFVQALGPYGAAGAVALMVVAAAYMVRRGRQSE